MGKIVSGVWGQNSDWNKEISFAFGQKKEISFEDSWKKVDWSFYGIT